MSNWTPRLEIVIPGHLWHKKKRLIPHGMGRKVFTKILEDLLFAVDRHGVKVLASIIDGDTTLWEILLEERRNAATERPNEEHNGDES